eukprot:1152756-Pelagomonas_calceolata.AAC.2
MQAWNMVTDLAPTPAGARSEESSKCRGTPLCSQPGWANVAQTSTWDFLLEASASAQRHAQIPEWLPSDKMSRALQKTSYSPDIRTCREGVGHIVSADTPSSHEGGEGADNHDPDIVAPEQCVW